jgi:hypothetical protein
MAFRLELSASLDYHDNLLPDFPGLLARTSSRRSFYLGLAKSLTWLISSIEPDATVPAFLLWLRRRPS